MSYEEEVYREYEHDPMEAIEAHGEYLAECEKNEPGSVRPMFDYREEKRVCRNCKHYEWTHLDRGTCRLMKGISLWSIEPVDRGEFGISMFPDFGCVHQEGICG